VPEAPAYLRIAADLRASILSGHLAPDSKLPSETQLMTQYGVSRTVAKWAVSVLKGEGLVEGRRGSGTYVRSVRRLVRHARGRDRRAPATSPATSPTASPAVSPAVSPTMSPSVSPTTSPTTSPFARDASLGGQEGVWRYESDHDEADVETARRLAIEPGDPVMSTRYVFLAGDEPIQLSHSREPLAITLGTTVEWPEAGLVVGVVARMDSIGWRIDETVERITARPATPGEAQDLDLPVRAPLVFVIERTYYAQGVPLETADIVIPLDRYELVYRLPVD
jgi:DNA-binding GntR family transcriptional regulator